MTPQYDHTEAVAQRAAAMRSVCKADGIGFELLDDDPITYRFDLNGRRVPDWLVEYDHDPAWALHHENDVVTATMRVSAADIEARHNALYGTGSLRELQVAVRTAAAEAGRFDEYNAAIEAGTLTELAAELGVAP